MVKGVKVTKVEECGTSRGYCAVYYHTDSKFPKFCEPAEM